MRSIVSKKKFLKDFENGAEIIVNLSGTTFECKLDDRYKRVDIISILAEHGDESSLKVCRNNEPDNIYDKNGAATRVDVALPITDSDKMIDVGYIPVRATVSYYDENDNMCTYVSDSFNFDIYNCEYSISIVRLGISRVGPWVTVCLTHC